MSFQNGISTLQQIFPQLDPAGTSATSATGRASQAGRDAQPTAPTAASTTSGLDQASLSNGGGLVALAAQTPDVRMEKIAPLQAAIAAGTYNVSSSAVADKIVGAMLGRSMAGSGR